MKMPILTLTLASLSFISTSLQASERGAFCSQYIEEHTLEDFKVIKESETQEFPEDFYRHLNLHSFTERRQSCLPLLRSDFVVSTGEVLSAYQTQNDSCDGGNTHGTIVDQKGVLVGLIVDYDFYCHLEKLTLTVEQVVCGEIDPYAVGDACVLLGKVGGQGWGLVFSLEDFLATYGDGQGNPRESELVGKKFDLNKKHMEKVVRPEALEQLRLLAPKHTFYNATMKAL